jgi:hypothetical protein
MPDRRLHHHFRNHAVGYIALFISLGGTSCAAFSLPAGSVGTRQLRDGAVTSGKLAKGAVTAGSLDLKSIAGHIADWAQIRSDGHVVSSAPRATVQVTTAGRGLYRVSWSQSIGLKCMAMANPSNVPAVVGSATATTFGPSGHGRSTNLLVQTFDASGNNVPANVNVIVVCP